MIRDLLRMMIYQFQSTPLREGRLPIDGHEKTFCFCFNPRPCARGDPGKWFYINRNQCFNPRPCARGDGSSASRRQGE